ncbi:MAG: glycosyltransferase, partial [Phycisphaerales bacterium]|nr:glycosyltransferase [Phycisphaerales bacterium]
PSIVLPYPYHQDDHQRTNAEPLEELGGVYIANDHKQLELNLKDAGVLILELLKQHQTRFTMRQAMVESPSSNGADAIGSACLSKPD